jgi:hypothetical protein
MEYNSHLDKLHNDIDALGPPEEFTFCNNYWTDVLTRNVVDAGFEAITVV